MASVIEPRGDREEFEGPSRIVGFEDRTFFKDLKNMFQLYLMCGNFVDCSLNAFLNTKCCLRGTAGGLSIFWGGVLNSV